MIIHCNNKGAEVGQHSPFSFHLVRTRIVRPLYAAALALLRDLAPSLPEALRVWAVGPQSRQNGAERHQIDAERSKMAPNRG